jgi:hypothetical protein
MPLRQGGPDDGPLNLWMQTAQQRKGQAEGDSRKDNQMANQQKRFAKEAL